MKLPSFYTLLLMLIFINKSYSQQNINDSSIRMTIVSINYAFYLTGGDMAKRFGNSNSLGLTCSFKNTANYLFSASFDYLFGSNIKETDMLDHLRTSAGYLITGQGLLADVIMEERGYDLLLKAGKLKSFNWPNPNSGIYCQIGAGFIEHKISFKYNNGPLNQLSKEYIKGYDRLTNGMTLYECIGYQFFSKHNLGNFHIAVEFLQAFTKNRRSWNFDTMEQDTHLRYDLLYGINIGMDLPLYKRAVDQYFF